MLPATEGTAIPDAHDILALAAAYAAGAVPFAQLGARLARGADLREVDTGTVSGTNLYRIAGFGPLAIAGVLDVAKGAVGPLIADDPTTAAVAVGVAVAAHNWSPYLRFAGGRGISPAMGGLLVVAWPGTALLIGGLAIGKLVGQTGLVSFLSQAALIPALAVWGGPDAALAGAAVLVPMWGKRLAGNQGLPAGTPRWRGLLHRLLFDNDQIATEPVGASERATSEAAS